MLVADMKKKKKRTPRSIVTGIKMENIIDADRNLNLLQKITYPASIYLY